MRYLLGEAPKDEDFTALIDTPYELSDIAKDDKIAEFITALKTADKSFEDDDDSAASTL